MSQENSKTEKVNNSKEVKKLSTIEIIIFSLPKMGTAAIWSIVIFFSLIFYVNILGQPPLIIGSIFSISLVVYAFCCIFFGVIADRIGKKKLLIFSGPLLAISFILLWLPPVPPESAHNPGELYLPLIIWLIIVLLIFRIASASFFPVLHSMIPDLSTDEQNRVKLSMISMIMMNIGGFFGTVGPILVMGDATKDLSRDKVDLYYLTSDIGRTLYVQISFFALLIGIIFVIFFITMMLLIKEPNKERNNYETLRENFKDLAIPMKDKNYRFLLITIFLFWAPFIVYQYLLISLTTLVISFRGNEFMIMVGISFPIAMLSFIFWNKLSEKVGVKKTLIICLIYSCVSFSLILIFLLPMPQEAIFIAGLIIFTLCMVAMIGTMVFPFVLVASCIDDAELKHQAQNKSLSGLYTGVYSMIGSFSSAFAMLVVAIGLEFFGPEEAIGYILLIAIIGPMMIIVSLFIFQKVKISDTQIK